MSRHVRARSVLALVLALALSACGQRKPAPRPGPVINVVSVAWTDITIQTAIVVEVLRSLGYAPEVKLVSVPVVFEALALGEADLFLGYWVPSMKVVAEPYLRAGKVVTLAENIRGARYSLAVPSYVARAGLRDFKDITRFRDRLAGKIHGIEPGNDGNLIIQRMIDRNQHGLGGFELVPASEAGMLAAVRRSIETRQWIVFLGWSPHPMNRSLEMTFLTGSTADTFGPDDGAASVYTVARRGFTRRHPALGRLLARVSFPIAMMNELMEDVSQRRADPARAGMRWLKAHPQLHASWLKDVRTRDGRSGIAAFRRHLRRF